MAEKVTPPGHVPVRDVRVPECSCASSNSATAARRIAGARAARPPSRRRWPRGPGPRWGGGPARSPGGRAAEAGLLEAALAGDDGRDAARSVSCRAVWEKPWTARPMNWEARLPSGPRDRPRTASRRATPGSSTAFWAYGRRAAAGRGPTLLGECLHAAGIELPPSREGTPTDGCLVQRLIDPVCAGVMFTINPASGSWREMTIEAAWGLGDSVASGTVMPDHYRVKRPRRVPRPIQRVLARVRLRVVEDTVRPQETALHCGPDGLEERRVAAPRVEAPKLLHAEVLKLCRLGLRVEGLRGTRHRMGQGRRGDAVHPSGASGDHCPGHPPLGAGVVDAPLCR